jgi:hypothetical protein
MPGCNCSSRRHGPRTMNAEGGMKGSSGKGRSQGPGSGQGGRRRCGQGAGQRNSPGISAGDTCLCPTCGHREIHEQGVPCTQKACPKCGASMTRG